MYKNLFVSFHTTRYGHEKAVVDFVRVIARQSIVVYTLPDVLTIEERVKLHTLCQLYNHTEVLAK